MKLVLRACVCFLMLGCFTHQALAQTDHQYVIMHDGHYLSHINNSGTWGIGDATSFSPNSLWFSSNNYNYYFNDGTNSRYLRAPLERNGVISFSDAYPGTQVLNNTTENYYFYDWNDGLARGLQHYDPTCPEEYNNLGSECWEVVWVSYENSQWQMSSVYGYDPTTHSARFYPVTVTEHPQEISVEEGGVSSISDFELDFNESQTVSVSVTPYSYTYTPAYTTYVFNGSTHNYYNNTDNGENTPVETTSTGNDNPTYAWTLSGPGAGYLTLTGETTASPTITYNTQNTTGHKTATLTLTVTYSNGIAKQVRTAEIEVKTPCQNPAQAAAPVVSFEDVTVSWVHTADGYKVYCKKSSETSYGAPVTVGSVTSHVFSDLEYNTSYTYKIAAICEGTELANPTEHTFTTKAQPDLLVYGAVFGGGRMADVTGKTEVAIINCDSIGAVYGGNDIAGAVEGAEGSKITLGVNTGNPDGYAEQGTTNAPIKIGSVYGGGNGYYAYNGNAFEPATSDYQSETVGVGESVKAMTLSHEVGEVVWTNTSSSSKELSFPAIVKTEIIVTNDYVAVDSLFGGAKNAFLTTSSGNGSTIKINGGTVFAVFGGNNFGGTQGHGKHHIDVNATKIPATLTPNITSTATTGFGRDFGIRYLFGGGNKVYGSTTEIFVYGGMTDTIFAGGNSADVYAANVTVNCSIASGSNNVFGNTYSYGIDSYSSGITPKTDYAWDGKGIYNVHTLFGGNNQASMEGIPSINLTSGSVGTVYGGGNAGDMLAHETDNGSGGELTINGDHVKYGTHVELNSPDIIVDNLYGGCQLSNVHYSTWVELKEGHVGTVYGGCNVSGDVGSTRVNLDAPEWSSPEVPNPDYQEVYGGTYVVATGGIVYKNLFAGGNGYYHCVNNYGKYIEGIDYADPEHHYIGLSTPTHNETHVVINTGATVKGNVYAGGNLASVGFDNNSVNGDPYPRFRGLSSVRMVGGTVDGDVYGGGNMANVYGSNEVQVSGGTITGSLYGGNDRTGKVAQISNRVLPAEYNVASDGQTSLLSPKVYTYVSVTGNPTITNVYGGGNGDYEYFDNFADAEAYTGGKETVVGCNIQDNQPIQRATFVDVSIDGGASGGHIGTVYGGGDGVTVTEFLKVFLNVKGTTDVSNVGTIFGGNNKGKLELVPDIILLNGQVDYVYGGCNEGKMEGNKNITFGEDTYTGISSYVRLLNEYKPNETGTAVTPTAKVMQAVYGGCKSNGTTNNSLVLVEGGNHEGVNLFGGSDVSGTIEGTSWVVVKGGTITDAYGGGNGNYDYSMNPYTGLTAPYSENARVDMLGGTVQGNLYAGGYAGECGNTVLNMEAGTVAGSLFGGGNMAGLDHNSEVEVSGGTVATGIYGGCNTTGTVGENTNVSIIGGTVNNVYGGGLGIATGVDGDVTVNIGSDTGTPTVNGNVYGGSSMGTVNNANTDLTQVNILNGTLNGDIYGGGQGVSGDDNKGKVNGQVEVNIGAYTAGVYSGNATFGSTSKVFGCNDAGGSPQDNVTVNVYQTAHNTTNSYPDPVPTNSAELVGATANQFAIQAVYGGGNLADYTPASNTNTATVHVFQCDQNTIKDVYGGSNQAAAQNTHVIIDGGRIDRTFGGGNGVAGPADVVGTAKTEINAGLITQVFGGSNTNGAIGNIDLTVIPSPSCPELINEVFSGNNEAPMFGDIVTNLVGDCDDILDGTNYYGGTNLAPIYGNVTLNVYGGYYTNVFGGSKGYIDPLDASNNIAANIMKYPTIAEVQANPGNYPDGLLAYLQANTALEGTGGNVTLNLYGGHIVNAFGGSDVLGNIEGNITVNVIDLEDSSTICPLDLTNVYGGGHDAAYTPALASNNSPEVNILNGTVSNNVFGGGLGETATVTSNPTVTLGDLTAGNESYQAYVKGNVYGGGELASIDGNTMILLQKENTLIEGTVYGGGKGSETAPTEGLVTKNTTVDMRNGQVERSIYGGGELGSVGTFTAYYTAGESELHVAGEPKTCQPNTGLAKVLISGGRVGSLQPLMPDPNGTLPDPNDPASNDDYGYVFCASRGLNSGDDAVANLLAVVDTTYLEIRGSAVITASVYGGSENGQVLRNTHVSIKGGQIGIGHYNDGTDHWDAPYTETAWTTAINKIKNGTFTDADAAGFHVCDAWAFGDEEHRYVYDFYAGLDGNYEGGVSSNGGNKKATDGHSFFGHVFGGGSGYYPYAPGQWRRSAGRVNGNTYVEVTGGHILTNIYGGNEITDVIGGSKVVMTGGTLGVPRSLDSIQGRPVNCNLFGAGMGDPRIMFNQWSNVASTEVIVGGDAVVFGSVFGGGEDGHVLGNVSTTIKDNALVGTLGTSGVDGNAFGGGRGFSGIALTAGVVCGNVTLNIQDNASILGSVYGGGRMAAVGTYLRPEGDSEYGILQPGDDHGNVTININGGSIGNHHLINATNEFSIGDVYGGSKGTLVKDVAHNQRLGLVKNTTVNIAQPAGKTTRIYGSVYGGGEIGSVGHFNYATADQAYQYNATHPSEEMNVGDVYEWVSDGLATINISGGEIGQSNTTDYVKGHVFGGCLGKTGNDFSGYSFVDRSIVTISGGKMYGAVFGGGENGHVYHDTRVNIQGGKIGIRVDSLPDPLPENIIYRGNVYGGGRGIDQDKAYCITAGKVYGNTEVNITGGTIYRNVYGGGSLASVGDTDETPQPNGSYLTGLATVNVTGGQIGTDGGYSANDYSATPPTRNHLRENGFVYGSGRGVAGPATSEFAYVKNTEVTIGGTAYVTGSVFGGGENGHVRKNTNVTVNNGTGYCHQQAPLAQDIEPYPVIGYPLTTEALVENLQKPIIVYRGNVYGGGRGVDFYIENGVSHLSRTAGVVQGNTVVTINGGTIRHDVYGGGSMASVGTYTYDGTTGEVIGVEAGTGLSTVIVNNGIIGMSPELDIVKQYNTDNDPTSGILHNLSGINNGQVFGGGRGESGSLYKNLAYVDTTNVYIHGGLICGAVFGGGCNGHVKEGTYVSMDAGEIGHELSDYEKTVDFTHPHPIYFGNVYGGGRGIDHANLTSTLSKTAGRVYGNTRVDISGGVVHHDVYGGGSLANVGTYTEDAGGITYISGGTAIVNITGTADIGTNVTTGSAADIANAVRNSGYVYGSGRGMAGSDWSDMAYVKETYVNIGTEGGSDNPMVKASVFGGGSNGHVYRDTHVNIYTGTIGTPLTAEEMVEIDPSQTHTAHRPRVYRGNVYGGGRGVERDISGGTPVLSETAGRVFGNTNVTVAGGKIYHNIYGGGSLASVGTYTIDGTGHHIFNTGTGTATITVNGGVVGMSPDEASTISGATQWHTGLNSGQIYGSGRGEAGAEYSGMAFTDETYVNVNGGTVYGAVFGGGANGHVKHDTHVAINGGTIGVDDITVNQFSVYRGNVYGGGRGIDLDGSGYVSPTAGMVYGNTEVTVTGGTIYHNVFGGGSLASVGTTTGTAPDLTFENTTGSTNVTISGGTIGINGINNGRVFGAGRGYPNPNLIDLTYVKETNVNILNGANIKGCVFGSGDNGQVYNDTYVTMTGGTVGTNGSANEGNIFGGGRGQDTYGSGLLSPTAGIVYGNTNVDVSGGIVKANIYGGGDLSTVGKYAFNIDGSGNVTGINTIDPNTGTTNVIVRGDVTVGGSSYGNVFGAGRGDQTKPLFARVNYTNVTIGDNSNHHTQMNNVYGGGENGDVTCGTLEVPTVNLANELTEVASTVTMVNGDVSGDVFGGGDQGTTQGQIIVNMNGGTIHGELFGGAKGSEGSVFVAGLKTVNVRGGTVYNHVYGGSRNANDGLYFDANATNQADASDYTAFVNISGGLLRGDVYGAGYYGLMFGSSDVNIGKDAIDLANAKNINRGTHTPAYLQIIKNVYAGSNWGEYDPAVPFANSTTTGHSNVYLDGNGYDTQSLTPPANTTTSTYMDLGGSIYGSGTSGDAGTQGRKIQIANFGHPILANQTLYSFDGNHSEDYQVLNSSTRNMQSVQRCDTLIIDNSTVKFTGQGDISQNYNTVEYVFMYIDKGVYVRNGSNIVANTQIDEMHALFSEYRPEEVGGQPNGLYVNNPKTYWIGIGENNYQFYYIDGTTATSLDNDKINTFRFNGGYSMYVRYNKQYVDGAFTSLAEETFGELKGFFRMVTENDNETFAHARPKMTSKAENVADGGFMSYYNEYHNNFTDSGSDYTKGLQFPYENVLQTSKADRPDYRYWRIRASETGNQMVSPMAFFLYSNPSSADDFITIERTITLPTLNCTDDSYFVFSSIDYGDHAHLVNVAIDEAESTSKYWIVQKTGSTYEPQFYGKSGPDAGDAAYYQAFTDDTQNMREHPNTYFGLVVVPEGSLEGVANPTDPTDINKEYLISSSTAEMLSESGGHGNPAKFYYPANPNGKMAKITIRLTYYKEMTMSMALSPVTVQLKSYCGSSTDPMDIISIPIYITTQTALGQDMTTTSYAMFGDLATGNNPETYNVKATMPPFVPIGMDVPFYVYGLSYTPNQSGDVVFESKVTNFAETDYNYAMLFKRGFNSDNKSGWRESIESADTNYFQIPTGTFTPIRMGSADGRTPFSIDFTLFYNSCTPTAPRFTANQTIGQLTFDVCFPKAKEDVGLTPDPSNSENWAKFEHFSIHIDLFKRDRSTGFYLDGIAGSNNYTGSFANDGKRTLQNIIDNNWMPGDKVWVVRPITLTSSSTTWTSNNGAPIVLYRYPGSFVDPDHYSIDDTTDPDHPSWYKDNNASNPVANTGIYTDTDGVGVNHSNDDQAIFANISSKAHLVLDNIILDGYNDDTNPQERPLIKVTGGGTVTITNSSEVRNSNNHQDGAEGSAVYVGDNSNLILLNGVNIHDNKITNTTNPGNGAAVYLDKGGTLTVGGLVNITHNTVNGTFNNVYLYVEDATSEDDIKESVVHIGEDGMDPHSVIGVTKTEFYEDGDLKDLTPIATSIYAENIHNAYTYDIFKDDTRKSYTHYFIENTLYYGRTWAHFVTSEPAGFAIDNIDSKEDLAWYLSYVNGLNGSEVHANAQAKLTANVNMSEHYWKPVGIIEDGGCPEGFVGSFDGQWNTIDGLVIKREGFHNIGLFDNVGQNGIVKNVVLGNKDSEIHPWNPDPVEQYAGGIVGTVMNGGTVTACEAAPNLSAYDATSSTYMGGVAGRVDEGGMVHSCIGMPNLEGYTMGGLVGKVEGGGYLVNSYAITRDYSNLASSSNYVGGLVGRVMADGYVENCYVKSSTEPDAALPFGWFVGSNAGNVSYCYAPAEKTNYIYNGSAPVGYGNYDPVIDDIKALGYLYDDNKVTLAAGQTNSYHSETLTYADGRIDKWPGMLSALSHWVTEKNSITDPTSPYYQRNFTPWFRPNTTYINGDLPVLGVNDYVSMSTTGDDVNTLRYEAKLDGTLTRVNANTIDDSYVFLYGKDNNVKKVPEANVHAFINEDAVLIQDDDEGGNFEATVGITFDNSWGKAHDYFENTLEYDWHLMSTPLYNAPMGTDGNYNMSAEMAYGSIQNLTKMENGYFPNGMKVLAYGAEDVKWDFYAYDEPDYHWINFKRSTYNHWHIDTINGVYNPPIHYSGLNDLGPYVNETEFVPGKGYMMAISQDSYLSNKGILNKSEIYVPLTAMAPTNEAGKPTYDKGSNLVGNPYQAYLDLERVSAVNNTLKGFYFYNADSDNSAQGMYVPYTPGMSLNPIAPKRYIHPHQAFFVVTESNQPMTFDQSMATTNLDENAHFRNTGINYPLVNLVVSDTLGNGDLCIVEFKRPELGGVNKINNLRNADFKLYAHYENEDYGLLFTPTHAKRVPLFFKTPNNGKYTLSWNTHNGTFTSMYLVDNLTGVYYDMLANDKYTFEAKATDYAARFYIVFSVTDVDEYDDDDINDTFAYFNGYGWVIEGEGQLDLIDMLGHVLYSNVLSGESTLVHFDDIASGMYMLRLTKGQRVVASQKIVIY